MDIPEKGLDVDEVSERKTSSPTPSVLLSLECVSLNEPTHNHCFYWHNVWIILVSSFTKYMVRQIEKTVLNTVLTINSIDSQDQGEFALKIKNRCGEDKYAIGIQVRDSTL